MRAPITRRTFLRQAGGIAVGLTLVPLAGCEDNGFTPVITGTTDIPFLTPIVSTEGPSFYTQFGGEASVAGWPGVPELDRTNWQLTIDGLVDAPLTVRFIDLQQADAAAITVLKTLRCITDAKFVPGLVGNALWTGVPLRLFLERAGVDPARTRRLRVYGADGFTNNIRVDQVWPPPEGMPFEPLLVYDMNNAPLTPGHGFPVRLLMPGAYGFKDIKWISRIEATAEDTVFGSYQEVVGYTDEATIRVENKVTAPVSGQVITAGPFKLFGYALSGYEGIERVDVALDDGAFVPARLLTLNEILAAQPEIGQAIQLRDPDRHPYPFQGVWTLWDYRWDATPGKHTFRVRATDRAGNVQPAVDDDLEDGLHPIFEVQVQVS